MFKLLAFILVLFTMNSSFNKVKEAESLSIYISKEDSLHKSIDSICNLRIEYFVKQAGSYSKLEEYFGMPIDSLRAHCKELWLDSLVISPDKK